MVYFYVTKSKAMTGKSKVRDPESEPGTVEARQAELV